MKVVQCAIYIVFGKTNTLQFKKILLTKQVGNTKNENTSEIPVERTKTKVWKPIFAFFLGFNF